MDRHVISNANLIRGNILWNNLTPQVCLLYSAAIVICNNLRMVSAFKSALPVNQNREDPCLEEGDNCCQEECHRCVGKGKEDLQHTVLDISVRVRSPLIPQQDTDDPLAYDLVAPAN